MSIIFYGKRANGVVLRLDFEDTGYFTLSNDDGIAFLSSLGFKPGDEFELAGEVAVPMARRAIMKARATLDRKVDREHFKIQLDSFELFLNVAVEKGATTIFWV